MTKAPVIRVVIADDHPLMRDALKLNLEKDHDIRVVGEASNGEEAVAKVIDEEPEVALFDIKMPPLPGIQAMTQVLKECPGTRVIILTVYTNDPFLDAARYAGASGFLPKTATSEQVRLAVRTVASGNTFFPGEFHERLIRREKGFYDIGGKIIEALSQKELETLLCVANGGSNHEIAERLSIDAEAIRSRLRTIFEKLHVRNRTQAVSMAIREHWIDLEANEILLPGIKRRGDHVE